MYEDKGAYVRSAEEGLVLTYAYVGRVKVA